MAMGTWKTRVAAIAQRAVRSKGSALKNRNRNSSALPL